MNYDTFIIAAITANPGINSGDLNEAVHAQSGKRSNAPVRSARDQLLAKGVIRLETESIEGRTAKTYHWYVA